MLDEKFIVGGESVSRGERKRVKFKVTKLPSGHEIEIFAHVIRAIKPGPCVLILGGVHGDEINGVEIVRRLVANKHLDELMCGDIIAIPILNIFGFINFSRDFVDGKDINRSFPGTNSGSLASRVAKTLSSKILPGVDVILDFHTGGAQRHNHPQIRFTTNQDTSRELAQVFAAPFTIVKDPINRSLRQLALKEDKACLVFEGGESLRFHQNSIDEAIDGTLRVLRYKEMLSGKESVRDVMFFKKASWLRANVSGMFLWKKSSGDLVQMNEVIAEINEPYGGKKNLVKANRDGFIIGHNNSPLVTQGDALFHIGHDWTQLKSKIRDK